MFGHASFMLRKWLEQLFESRDCHRIVDCYIPCLFWDDKSKFSETLLDDPAGASAELESRVDSRVPNAGHLLLVSRVKFLPRTFFGGSVPPTSSPTKPARALLVEQLPPFSTDLCNYPFGCYTSAITSHSLYKVSHSQQGIRRILVGGAFVDEQFFVGASRRNVDKTRS